MKPNLFWAFSILIIAAAAGFFFALGIPPFSFTQRDHNVSSTPLLKLPQETQTPKPLNSVDFSLAKVRLSMTSSEVEGILGTPNRKNVKSEPSIHNPDYTSYFETWVYPGLEIMFLNAAAKDEATPEPGPVFAITATSPRFATPRDIKVGDRKDKLFIKYGRTSASEGSFTYEEGLSILSFSAKKGIIDCIEVQQFLD